LVDGSDWISVTDATTELTFSGTYDPNSHSGLNTDGTYEINVIATDTSQKSITEAFYIKLNRPPELVTNIDANNDDLL